MEGNLNALLGVDFLASEHTTDPVHGGRIDTLGIDENGCPVIVEYKRATNENVINQGLFYLDWLMDHRDAFKWMVMEKLGKERAESIDWSNPRLLCIAGDFTRYDEHAVQQINRNIELIRYRRYGDEFLLFELVNSKSASSQGEVGEPEPDGQTPYKTVTDYLAQCGPDVRGWYDSLKSFNLALGDDVQEKTLKNYIAFKRIRNFVCIEAYPQAGKLMLFLRLVPDDIEIEEGFSRDVREIGHFGTGDLELTVDSDSDVDRALPLIQRSYERI